MRESTQRPFADRPREGAPYPPAQVNPDDTAQSPRPRGEPPLLKILVVDDSRDDSLLVRLFLNGRPYRLAFEEDGRAAVERSAIEQFDLILMDLQMPLMGGLEATRAIRALERQRGSVAVPIIAFTAHNSPEDRERSFRAGCSAHLPKPASRFELVRAIESHGRETQKERRSRRAPLPITEKTVDRGSESTAVAGSPESNEEIAAMLEFLARSGFALLAPSGPRREPARQVWARRGR